ncbi:hypothetical protein T281_01145 [Rhodomicrobium udaipurense JA643]|uniref:FAD-dependent oxidoreductase n=1 Tax=Rhodomicrobium udaipurense TaxID=1202716 RepID=A0A8I1KM62_9HYPH|nr:hydroxysqualene dehydroxylase HpnE [Rhodomicrobium udaipurense]KAI96259.1 hypothetical protein T281_01145 [Rhodomicrobium udaipurense JA643]MBJ7544768.1 FAD-dependent oxidoreductase [Rhodomicrobium udaipurense]
MDQADSTQTRDEGGTAQGLPEAPAAASSGAPLTHVIGAGLAGLSAAVRLAERGHPVAVYEASIHAGGRCRSYYDATLDQVIDNGNHLLLSGNDCAFRYLSLIGGAAKMHAPAKAEFPFADLITGERWTLSINDGRLPLWLFDAKRRVPGTKPLDYLGAARLMWAGADKTVTDVIAPKGTLYERLWLPLMIAALNTDPAEASAKLAGTIMRETLAKGGEACRPLVAEGLSAAFIDPALDYLRARGHSVTFGRRLKRIAFADGSVTGLDFGDGEIPVAGGETVILAVPQWIAPTLVPGLSAPTEVRSILNAHFRIAPPAGFPPLMGVVGGTIEWLFAFENRLSITISGADRLVDRPRETLAADLWREVVTITGLPPELPPWQIVKEKRATFAATPAQDAVRPNATTQWRNLFLAGDWTQTGLPATIEGAIRSGERAALLTMRV